MVERPSATVRNMVRTGLTTPRIAAPFRTRLRATTTTTTAASRTRRGIVSRKKPRRKPLRS